MKKRSILAAVIFFLILLQPMTAYADMGPKPCIYVTFENLGSDRTVYASFFALEGGPSPVSFGDRETVPEEIMQEFLDYAETEDARFVEDIWIINEADPTMDCGYMPPERYKLVVYIPEEDRMLESDFCTRDSFEVKYTVDLAQTGGKLILEQEAYDWSGEVLPVLLRVVLTVVTELAIAFLFRIRGKRSVGVIVLTNVATQLFLNIGLLLAAHKSGALAAIILYFLMEVFIFLAEAVVYAIALRKVNDPPVGVFKATAYAFAANLVTFAAGILLV